MFTTRRCCVVFAAALLLASCAETADNAAEEQPADTAAAMAEPSLADYAGTWNMRSVPESGADMSPTIYQIQVAGDQWTLLLPDRDPIITTTVVSGDSVIVDAGPYESVRRKGLMVTTHSVFRVSGGQMTGTTTARYQTSGADSVLVLRAEGSRAQ